MPKLSDRAADEFNRLNKVYGPTATLVRQAIKFAFEMQRAELGRPGDKIRQARKVEISAAGRQSLPRTGRRCEGTRFDGQPCQNRIKAGESACFLHKEAATVVGAEIRRMFRDLKPGDEFRWRVRDTTYAKFVGWKNSYPTQNGTILKTAICSDSQNPDTTRTITQHPCSVVAVRAHAMQASA